MKTKTANINICPVCKSNRSKLAFTKYNYSHFSCYDCKSVYVYPSPSSIELEEFYRNNEVDQLSQICWTNSPDSHRHVWEIWKEGLEDIDNLSGHGSLLDIGCGSGQFLAFAQKLGWTELIGIELVPEVANLAKQIYGTVIYTSNVLELSLPSQSFSGIVLWDIIEHLNDVESVLKEAFRLLKPGGVIFIGTVNCDGVSMRLLKENALTVNPPEHLVFFTQKGMTKALHDVGFKLHKTWSFSIYLREWSNFLSKLTYPQENKKKSNEYSRPLLFQSKMFLVLIGIVNTFLRITNLGDELVAIAQKPQDATDI